MENNQLIPPVKNGRPQKYGFDILQKHGDSLFIATDDPHKVRDAAYKYARNHGFTIATRSEKGGIAVYYFEETPSQ